jgi:hypothetical protein
MLRNRRQTKAGESSGPHEVGLVHLPGQDHHDHETFCGFSWSGNEYEDTTDPATCPGCQQAAEQAEAILKHAKRVGRKRRRKA